jgi:hypothetical protein
MQADLNEAQWQFLCRMIYWAAYESENDEFGRFGFLLLRELKRQLNLTPRALEKEELETGFQVLEAFHVA